MVGIDPLRGGPAGPGSMSGISNSFSPGSSGSLGESIKNYVSNQDEQVVLSSNAVAFYKGVLVVRVPFMNNNACSIGVIFMGDECSENLLKHEYGRTEQLRNLGFLDYLTYVAMPSFTFFACTQMDILPENYYYSYPWEYQADYYGGARHSYEPWANTACAIYWCAVDLC